LKKSKIILAVLILSMMALIFSGCGGVSGPKTAKLNISIEPNPVPYDSQKEGWPFLMTISESNGVGVTVSSIRVDGYNQEEELDDTDIFYEETIIDWFESDYIPAFSSIQSDILASGITAGDHSIVTVTGVDDNNNPIEATGRIDFLPK